VLRSEFVQTAKDVSAVMAFLLVLPLVYILDSETMHTGTTLWEYLVGGYAILWLVATGFTSWRMFFRERRDGAHEYLLSLPAGSAGLLAAKAGPRLIVIVALHLAGSLLSPGGLWFYDTMGLLTFTSFVLGCGLALGAMRGGGWSSRLMMLVMGTSVFVLAAVPEEFFPGPFPWGSDLIKLLLPVGVLVVMTAWSFSRLDLGPPEEAETSFTKLGLLPMVALAWPAVTLLVG